MKSPKSYVVAWLLVMVVPVVCQDIRFERTKHESMLKAVKTDIEKNYYDPLFRNIDIQAKYDEAMRNLEKANSIGQLGAIVAQFMLDFEDSHTYFLLPAKSATIDYGIRFSMFGEKCRVVRIQKGSDAEKKGLQVGDDVLTMGGYRITRDSFWKTSYYFFELFPQATLALDVIKRNGTRAQLEISPKITNGPQIISMPSTFSEFTRQLEKSYKLATRQYINDKFEKVFIWKMPEFNLEPRKIDDIIGQARKFPAMILDLRGNPGGNVDTEDRLIGNMFDRDVKVVDEQRRKEIKEVIAKSRGKDAYPGKLVVLVDSGSASASEVFARVMQLENRGIVIGDRTAGAVMESGVFEHKFGTDVIYPYQASVTIANLIMKDGKSLEKVGVTPDILILPTQTDVAANRDIVMAKALETLGIVMTPESAAQVFPVEMKDK